MKTEFSERLKSALRMRHMSQRRLSEKAGLSEQAVSRYVSGGRLPNAEVLLRISKALGVSADYLIGSNLRSERSPEERFQEILIFLRGNSENLSKRQKREIIDILLDV